jgi:hypothetical protein
MPTLPTAIPSPSLPLPDPSDKLTFSSRKLEDLRWSRQDAVPGIIAAATVSYSNAVESAASAAAATSNGAAQVALATTQANNAAASLASAINAPGTNGTSTTTLTVGSGSKTWTTQTGKAWAVGQSFVLARTSDPENVRMGGVITAYNPTTGSMSGSVSALAGAGQSASDWTVSIGHALDLLGVRTTGDQTIAGVKTFTGSVGIGGTPGSKLDVLNGSIATRSSSDGYTTFKSLNNATPFGANYDRYEEMFDPGSQVYIMGTAHGGTGSPRALAFKAGGIERMRIDASTGNINCTGQVTATQFNGTLNGNAATATTVPNDAITTTKIANDAVTAAKIANGAVGTSQLATLGVADANILSVSASKLTGSISTSQVLASIAGATVGGVGTYAFLRPLLSSTYGAGAMLAGGWLVYGQAGSGADGGSPPGTWMCMGHKQTFGFDENNSLVPNSSGTTLWLRVS